MQFRLLWRTTTFRLTVLYGLMFAIGTLALLWLIYLRSAVYLTSRVDGILNTESDALLHSPRPGLRQRVIEELTINGDHTNVFALFAADGTRVAGNLDSLPTALRTDGHPLEIAPTGSFAASARLIARKLETGETLVVGRDVSQLREMRSIITSALTWSGMSILLIGLACGTAFSVAPLRRLKRLQEVAQRIGEGNLQGRMPISQRRDELDMFATTVNRMMDEVERLMSEVKGATEVIAHDLLSPLAHVTLQLRRLQQTAQVQSAEIDPIAARIEEVLERFRAILRIAELDSRQRRAGFSSVDLADVVDQVADLYQPLADAAGVRLLVLSERGTTIQADPKLLFEAISNLIDNAIKFAGRGSTIQIRIRPDATCPQIVVQDNGPGIANGERTSVLQRFYRSERHRLTPGSGLGLSIVAAIMRLHAFDLVLEDADPGLRVLIKCCTKSAGS